MPDTLLKYITSAEYAKGNGKNIDPPGSPEAAHRPANVSKPPDVPSEITTIFHNPWPSVVGIQGKFYLQDTDEASGPAVDVSLRHER